MKGIAHAWIAVSGIPHVRYCGCSSIHGILDYIYGYWFKCRACGRWVTGW